MRHTFLLVNIKPRNRFSDDNQIANYGIYDLGGEVKLFFAYACDVCLYAIRRIYDVLEALLPRSAIRHIRHSPRNRKRLSSVDPD